MNKQHFATTLTALISALLATIFVVACQQSQTPAAPAAESKPATSDVFIVFEGPWAIVPDPKDANSVLALAPKNKMHRPLGVVPANTILDAGIYDLTVPPHTNVTAPTFDKDILRTDVDPQAVQHALDNRSERYAVRLPKPDAYLAETRYPSRIGPKIAPDPSTEKNYATAVALHYSVTSKTGFSLAGTQDAGGAFKPLLLDLNTPFIRFTIDPAEITHDDCHTHARAAFRDLVRLIGVKLFVDFPGGTDKCRKDDPQAAPASKAQLFRLSPGNWNAGSDELGIGEPLAAGISASALSPYLGTTARALSRGLQAAFFFWHSDGGGCFAPIVVGNGNG
jgi:hypothetical protein